jgi:hypothetical protein
MKKITWLFFVILSLRLCVSAVGNPSDSLKVDSTLSAKPETNKFKMKKSPWLAVMQSAVLPGLGQFYNESYWKIPVILGLTAYLGYEIYDNNKKYLNYRDQYSGSQSQTDPQGDLSLKTLRNFYRDQRDEIIWYLTVVYVINLVDAYVDAHLFDFTVRKEKLLRLGFNPAKSRIELNINF